MATLNPDDFIITRKRKKYKFALFANSPLCFEAQDFLDTSFSQARSPKTMFTHHAENDNFQKSSTQKVNTLEIGAGTGLFSTELAARNQQKTFLACDVKADRLQKGALTAENKKLTNIHFLRAHVNQLEKILMPTSIKEIWLTFPDPFPKKRSAKHRLTHPNFLALYQKLLQRRGQFYFKTDNHALFDWSLEKLVACGWELDQLSYDLHSTNKKEEYKIITTFEEKFLGEGKPICFIAARPPGAGVANRQSNRRP